MLSYNEIQPVKNERELFLEKYPKHCFKPIGEHPAKNESGAITGFILFSNSTQKIVLVPRYKGDVGYADVLYIFDRNIETAAITLSGKSHIDGYDLLKMFR